MRKFTTTIALAAMALFGATTTVMAQEEESAVGKFRYYDGTAYNICSPNGEWLVFSENGNVVIYNISTEKKYEYNNNYSVNTITDSGIASGRFNSIPSYWTEENEWTQLSLGYGEQLGSCNAEQAYYDGTFIVGNVDIKLNGSNYWSPVVWYYDENSMKYGEPEQLPYYDKDPLGLQPQGMYIRGGISDDGTKVFGRIIDKSGFNYYPVVWNKKDNEWECEIKFKDKLINEDQEVPIYPEFEATLPDPYNWMSDEEKAAFDAAMKAYNDSISIFQETGNIDYMPIYDPERYKESYFGNDQDAQDRYNQYLEALNDYNEYKNEHNKLVDEYNIKYDLFFKDTTLLMTNLHMSKNGKYAVTRCKYSEDKINIYETPVLLDLENNEMHLIPTLFTDGTYSIGLSVLNDGTIFHYGPINGNYIATYVWKKGMSESITIEDWVQNKSNQAFEEISNRLGNSWGSVISEDGRIIKGTFDIYTSVCNATWIADLTAYDDYVSVKETNNEPVITVWPNPATDIINVKAEEVEYMQLFDLEGKAIRFISGENTMNVSDIASGLYILKVKSGNTIGIKKVKVQR